MHCDGVWNDVELQRKQCKYGRLMVHSDDIWVWTCMNVYVNKCECSPLTPIGLYLLLHFWVLYCFDFLEKVVGPGIQGLHVIGSSRPLSVLMYTNNSATILSVSLYNLYSDNGYGTMIVFSKSDRAVRECFMFCNLSAVYLSWILYSRTYT